MRMRITFATSESVKYVGHLDLARAWERAVRRSGLPLSYSQGFHPLPRIQFAAALPVGCTGAAEVADIFLDEEMGSNQFLTRLGPVLPSGIRLTEAMPVPAELPSLQSQVCGASYSVEVETGETAEAFSARLERFLDRPSAWRERRRGDRVVAYDLRPLVKTLRYRGACELGQGFETEMRSEPGATGRPDELLAELGFETNARRIERLKISFSSEWGAREQDGSQRSETDAPGLFAAVA
jgi:radical SAM-linked protein